MTKPRRYCGKSHPAQIWWKISSWDANLGENETNIDGN